MGLGRGSLGGGQEPWPVGWGLGARGVGEFGGPGGFGEGEEEECPEQGHQHGQAHQQVERGVERGAARQLPAGARHGVQQLEADGDESPGALEEEQEGDLAVAVLHRALTATVPVVGVALCPCREVGIVDAAAEKAPLRTPGMIFTQSRSIPDSPCGGAAAARSTNGNVTQSSPMSLFHVIHSLTLGGRGVSQLLILSDKGGKGGLDPPFLSDVICEQPLRENLLNSQNQCWSCPNPVTKKLMLITLYMKQIMKIW